MSNHRGEYDAAKYLNSEELIDAFLAVAFEDDGGPPMSADYVTSCLAIVARARKNISQLARDAGLSRQGVTKALEPGSQPSFDTVLKIAGALGYRITFVRPDATQAGTATAHDAAA
jgi:probable addiction module antidote protein